MVRYTLIDQEGIKDFRTILGGDHLITFDGRLFKRHKGKWIRRRTWLNNNGYECVDITKDRKRKHYLIHRLVAEAFVPNPDRMPAVNHKDENKLNNRADNLEWCTSSYNNSYGTKIERFKKTYAEYCKVNGGPRQQACVCLETGERFKGAKWAAQAFGVTHMHMIKACLYGTTVGGKYHFKYLKDLV